MTPSEEWNRLTLLEKLRKLNVGEFQPGLYAEAADEIERLRAELENEVDLSEMRLQGIRKVRDVALEEAAKVADGFDGEKKLKIPEHWVDLTDECGEPTGISMKQGAVWSFGLVNPRKIAAAIRALRAQHVVHSAPQSTMEGVFAMGDPEKTDLAVEIANLVGRAIEQGADVEEVKTVLNEVLDELEAQEGDEEDGESS